MLFDHNNDKFVDFDELLNALSTFVNRTIKDEFIPDQIGNLTTTLQALYWNGILNNEMDFETFKSFWSLFVLANVQQSIPFQEMYNDAPKQGGLDKGCT